MQLTVWLSFLLVLIGCSGLTTAHTKRSDLVDCSVCTEIAESLQFLFRLNATADELIYYATKACIDFHIQDETVCTGLIPMFRDMAIAVLSYDVSPSVFCGFVGSCPSAHNSSQYFNVTFPKPKPPHVPPKPPPPGAPTNTILQITDIHFDAKYVEGTNTQCGEPLCCREVNGPPKNASFAAGKFGDYNCDLSPAMLDSLLNHLSTVPQPDFVFWTGDNPPHDLWLQTREGQINTSAVLTDMIESVFPNVTVLPCIGNHEAVPVNSFPLPPGSSWLYAPLAKQWSRWLTADAVETFSYAGYYQMEMKPGLRVLSLNMNYCNNQNWWLLVNATDVMTDPGGMLSWMINVLQECEDNNEKVYIIGHIPPGINNCIEDWSRLFYQVVDRYEDTIIAQFYGHTHYDQFEVFYTQDDEHRPCGIAYISPSVTTNGIVNPSYRIYTTDNQTGYIVESTTYHADIPTANREGEAQWIEEYTASITYNMTSFFPQDWDDVIEKLEFNTDMFNQYYSYKQSGVANPPCVGFCVKEEICSMRSGMVSQYYECLVGNER